LEVQNESIFSVSWLFVVFTWIRRYDCGIALHPATQWVENCRYGRHDGFGFRRFLFELEIYRYP
jgi:hypothetical protein